MWSKMKTQEVIQKKIDECRVEVFNEKTRYSKREQNVAWVHALEWVLEDEKSAIKKRLDEIDDKRVGKNNRKETKSE